MPNTFLSRCNPIHSPRRFRRGGVLQGCLIALGIVVLLLVIGIIVVVMNWRGWMAGGMVAVTEALVQNAALPQSEKQEILAHVEQLGTDFKDKKVSMEDLGRVLQEIQEGPIIPVGGVMYFEQKYIANSGMSEEEKAAASRTLDRFARGVYEEEIPDEAVDEVLAPIKVVGPDGEETFKESPTQEEINEVLAAMKTKADDANMPDEDFEIDISDELGAAIDRALAEEPAAPAADPAEPAEPAEPADTEPEPVDPT